MIKIDRLNKNFGNNEVLKDISLEFLEGNIYGIVGENGAGKTTLFRCIAGLESYSGEILSENKPLKNHLGYLETEPFFYSRITGKEYIQLLCNARNKKVNIDEKIFSVFLGAVRIHILNGNEKEISLNCNFTSRK
ncbi:ATP-binding cassette domain-containing protein [Ornithobacterium rhinotracheale]|uniref:ATP-binding cassette domain-containing protein n=1 Tax=Ornithobacterium rhinotracheale TaxID=28251 RepID=UPI0023EBF6D9|nr:ATP-binding cassette domain-containing protein [Ornithobacterium rhinotracheale]